MQVDDEDMQEHMQEQGAEYITGHTLDITTVDTSALVTMATACTITITATVVVPLGLDTGQCKVYFKNHFARVGNARPA